jgi:hypothetical protein
LIGSRARKGGLLKPIKKALDAAVALCPVKGGH